MTLTLTLTLRDCEQVADLTLFAYPEADHADDRRVAYANAKYPHLEAVHMFKTIKPTDEKAGYPKQFDTSRISIPARAGAGMYIVQYFWRGYRDCIDVDVLPLTTPVPPTSLAMYGIGSATEIGGGGGGGAVGGGGGGGAVGGGGGGGAVGGGGGPQTKMSKIDHCQYVQGSYTLFTEEVDDPPRP